MTLPTTVIEPHGLSQVDQNDNLRFGFWISVASALVMTLVSIAEIFTLMVDRVGTEKYLSFGVSLSLVFISLISIRLCQKSKNQLGTSVLIAGYLLGSLSIPFIVSGMGLQVGLMTIMLVTTIGALTLRGKILTRAVIGSVILALYNVLMDYYGPAIAPLGNVPVANAITIGLFMVYAFLIFRQFRVFGLRTKLIIAFILVAVIPLAILVIINTRQLTVLLSDETNRELQTSAAQTANTLDTFIQDQLNNVYTEAQIPDIRDYLLLAPEERTGSQQERNALDTLNTLRRKRSSMIRTYALLDLNGINLLDTKTANVGKSERDQEYFIRPIDNGLNYISNVLFVEDGPSVYFSSPVWDARGKLLGVLRFQYNAQILQDVLMSSANQFTAPELYAVLMDKQYYIRYAHSRDYGAIYRSYLVLDGGLAYQLQSMKRLPAAAIEDLFTNQSDFVEWMNNRKEQPFYSTSAFALGGEPAISTYAELEKAPWVVVTRQSMDVALLPVEQQTEFSVILSLIVAVLMAGVAIGATQIFSAPISHLTSVAEQIAHGDLSARANVETADEVGALAKTFNSMTDELQNTLLDLEKRIKDRTRAIELSADISRRLSIILDPAQLVSEVVDLLQFAFDYYHVQIYLFDDARQNLVMVGGTGEAGKTMIDREQKLAKGQGLVGRASDTGAVVIAADTFKDPQWLPNPLLPETKSEIAVPIILGDLILGALDVQQDTVDGLGHQDADLLSAVANQVAIALRNARQFRRAQLQAERQVRLGAAIEQIQDTQTIENALQVAVRELGRLFDVSHARVRVGMKQDGNGSE